jgi:hypothetical protein
MLGNYGKMCSKYRIYGILNISQPHRPSRPVTGMCLFFYVVCILCCVLFERGVLFCVICVFLCVVSYCSTTAIGQKPICSSIK